MRNQLLAGAMAVALATGITTSAVAFGHGGGGGFHGGGGGFRGSGFGGFHGGGFHAGYTGFRGSYGAMRGSNFAGVRGFTGWRHGGWGGRRFVGGYGGYGYGPYYDDGYDGGLGLLGLGIGLATGAAYCSPYDYTYGYCGPGYVAGW